MSVQLTRLRPAQLLVGEWTAAILYCVVAWALFAHKGPQPAAAAGTLLAGIGIGFVRRAPFWSVGCCLVPLALSPLVPSLGFIAMPVVCAAIFRLADRRTALVAVAAAELGVMATALPHFRQVGALVPFGLVVLAAWIAGRVTAQYRRQSAELVVQQERMRIARELHDIVAHSIGVITVQAGYGHLVIDQQPDEARTALATIEQTGRRTLIELRQLLGVLRSDESAQLAPTPGLAQLEQLVEQTAKAGVAVKLTITGTPAELPPGVDLSAYRIVQEALTNVVKHASTGTAEASIDYRADEVSVRVVDQGVGSTEASRPGHGLVGLRERVSLYGGTLDAGPLAGKGFQVAARLPLAGHE